MQSIALLKEGDWVEEIYLVTSKQIATARNGVVFLSLKLADKTGEIDGKMWDSAEEAAGTFNRDDFVRVKGVASNYQGAMQIKLKSLERVDDSTVDIANFVQSSSRNPDEMAAELRAAATSVGDEYLRRLMLAFIDDGAFMEQFKRTPAARALHHNYVGGLIEHVLELVALSRDVAKHFPAVNPDLVTVGAFLHDIGKVRELAVRKTIEYTTPGRLIGHISLGYEMLIEKIASIPGFPEETAMLLKHIMLSHHGEYEFGSPKRPKIREAVIINYLDDLAAKINNFDATMKKEGVAEGGWTSFSKMYDRYLYRPAATPRPGEEAPESAEDAEGPATGKLPLGL